MSIQLVDAMKAAGAVMGDRSKVKVLVSAEHIGSWRKLQSSPAKSTSKEIPALSGADAGIEKSASWRNKQEPEWKPQSSNDDG